MSYYCEISFKKLLPSKIFPFFKSIKESLQKNEIIEGLWKDFRFSHPFAQLPLSEIEEHFEKYPDFSFIYKDRSENGEGAKMLDAAKEAMDRNLKFKWFYMENEQLLGCFGVPKTLQKFFDSTIAFQNSTDQDYDWNTWESIEVFRNAAEKAKKISLEDLMTVMGLTDDDFEFCGEEYWRKSLAYEKVWEMIEEYFTSDGSSVFISLLGPHDILTRLRLVRGSYEEWKKWYFEEIKEKNENKQQKG